MSAELNRHQKAMMVRIAWYAFSGVAKEELTGSARRSRAERACKKAQVLLNLYLKTEWEAERLALADRLADEFNDVMAKRFGDDIPPEMVLHIGLSMIEQLRVQEHYQYYRYLSKTMDDILSLLSIYDLDEMTPTQVLPAVMMGDVFESRIRESF